MNGFYGKKHSEELKQKIRERNLELFPNGDPKKLEAMWEARRGVTTSDLQKQRLSERSKGKCMLKDPISRISKQVVIGSEEETTLKNQGWMNPPKLARIEKRLKNETNSQD